MKIAGALRCCAAVAGLLAIAAPAAAQETITVGIYAATSDAGAPFVVDPDPSKTWVKQAVRRRCRIACCVAVLQRTTATKVTRTGLRRSLEGSDLGKHH